MSEQLTLPAETRDRAGKGASRALRRDGRVPAVVYGQKKDALSIHVEEKLLSKMLSTRPLHELGRDGRCRRQADRARCRRPSTSIRSSSRPIHVDFLRISEHTQGERRRARCASTMKRHRRASSAAAFSTSSQHELELVCDAAHIPDEIHIPLDGLEIGDLIHISEVKLPEGAMPAIDGPRLHRRHHRRPVGDEGRRGRGGSALRARFRPSVRKAKEAEGEGDKLPKAAKKPKLLAPREQRSRSSARVGGFFLRGASR